MDQNDQEDKSEQPNNKSITTNADDVFENNPMIEIFGKEGNIRILITLIDACGSPLTVSDIADQSGVNRQTFYNNEKMLKKYDLIEEADKIGNAKRYRVDLTYEPIQKIMGLYDSMIDLK